MLFTNAFLAATAFAVAIAQDRTGIREGKLNVCKDPGFNACSNVTYYENDCMDLEEFGLDNVMTGFDTYGFGCEFYGSSVCLTDEGYFTYRGAIADLLKTEYASNNDIISAFRCGT